VPLYVRQTANELTGEHTCVMVRGLNSSAHGELEWMEEFAKGGEMLLSLCSGSFNVYRLCVDFRRRFLSLLSFKFREFSSITALSVLEAADIGAKRLDEDESKCE
jgi:N-acetyltransferase 10